MPLADICQAYGSTLPTWWQKTANIVAGRKHTIDYGKVSNRGYSFSGSPMGIDALWVTLLGLAVCIYVSKLWINNDQFLLFVGANTLFYFAFHGKVYSLLQTIAAKVFAIGGFEHSMWTDTSLGFVITLLDALILILPAMFVNRYTPWLLGKGFKLWNC